MEELYAGLFRAMNRFGKLRIGELFSDMTKSDGMMLWAISQLNQEKNNGRATVSELAEKLHVKNLLLYHTEDKNIRKRKSLYKKEAKIYYKGNVYVPYDREIIELK